MRKAKTAVRILKSYLSYKLGRPKIAELVFYVTTRCNLRCIFCDRWRTDPGRELTTSEAMKILDMFIDEGVVYVDFSGGEPLLRRDLEELAKKTYDAGIINALNTNGTLVTPERAKRLAEVFDFISVSLDGFQELHDGTRGVPGTYRKVMEGIRLLKKAGAKVGIDATVYRANWSELLRLFEALEGLIDYVSLQPVGGSFSNYPYPPPAGLSLSPEEAEEFVHRLLELKREKPRYIVDPAWYIEGLKPYFRGAVPKICDAGRLYVAVNWRGDLQLCPLMNDTVVGNLLEEDLDSLLRRAGESEAYRRVKSCRGCWSQCTVIVSKLYREPVLSVARDLLPASKHVFSR